MGLVDEWRTLLFSIIDHYFAKKELKKKKKSSSEVSQVWLLT